MSSDERLRAGILGFGFAGRIFHAPFLQAAGFEVAAVATGSPDRAAQVRAEYPDAEVLASAESLIGRADLDLIVVATPNSSHAELAIAALEAGHDVVVDKPFAPTAAQAQQVVAAADSTGGVLSVFQSRRFDADFRTVQSVLSSGRLGLVHRFESRFERWRPVVGENWRESADPAEAGGLLYDLGSHLIDQYIALFAVPTSVYAEIGRRRPGAVAPDEVFLALHASGDVIGHLWMSAVAADAGPRFRVLGSAGAFVKHGMDPQEEALLAGHRPAADSILPPTLDAVSQRPWGRESEQAYGRIGAGEQWQPVVSADGDYVQFYREMAAAMRGDGPVPVDPADSIAGLRVIEAALRSAQSGTVEPV
ncbi:MAG: oxidoreductase [Frankiales bacterium]|nr:oxidoreductase [Frankiales bacterium]